MEIKNNTEELSKPDISMDKLLPPFNNLANHFLLADKSELASPEALNQAESSWKEIENFEFQKMDVKASFEQLIKRI